VPEVLWAPLQRLAEVYDEAVADPAFVVAFDRLLDHRVGRPTPLTRLERMTAHLGGGHLWLKREDLCHGTSFCSNLAALYGLLARRMGVRGLVGETATGDLGVALGSFGRALDLEVRVHMGRADMEAEPLQVRRMRALGVELVSVDTQNRGRRAAASEALRDWSSRSEDVLYCSAGLAAPDPYPHIISAALSVIGAEIRVQLERRGLAASHVIAPVGSGGFAAGCFGEFIDDDGVELIGIQGGGEGVMGRHAAPLIAGRPGVLHGTYSHLLQDESGQIVAPASCAPGLCSAQVGPQHARWSERGAVSYDAVMDAHAREAIASLARREGIFASIESGHALAHAFELVGELDDEAHVVVGISGEGARDRADVDRLDAPMEAS
jgi:tryptophan synthase beta chain